MGRVMKTGLDYFPVDVDFFEDEKIQFVTAKFGIEGEIVVLKLLCRIYRNSYFINWGEDEAILFANRLGGITCRLAKDIVDELLHRGFFNKEMFEKFGILTSRGIQKRYHEAIKRRKDSEILPEHLLITIQFKEEEENVNINDLNADINTQSKVKKSKVEERKENESKVNESKGYPNCSNENTPVNTDEKSSLVLPLTSYADLNFSSSYTASGGFTIPDTEFIPLDFNSQSEMRAKITSMLRVFCGIEGPERSVITRFYNIIVLTPQVRMETAFRFTLEAMREYNSFPQAKKNLAYLSRRIEGKINDGLIKYREMKNASEKRQEKKELSDMAKNNDGCSLTGLVENFEKKFEFG